MSAFRRTLRAGGIAGVWLYNLPLRAVVVKLVNALASGASARKGLGVRVPSTAPLPSGTIWISTECRGHLSLAMVLSWLASIQGTPFGTCFFRKLGGGIIFQAMLFGLEF